MSNGDGQTCGEMTNRIRAALTHSPLTLIGACLAGRGLEYADWCALPEAERDRIRDQTRGLLSYINFVEGRPLAQVQQGYQVVYFLL